MRRLLTLFFERVPEGRATRPWHARAYIDWTDFTRVMVIWPFHYVVQFSFWLNLKWSAYRHKKSWIDCQITAAIQHSEQQDARRFIRRYLESP